MGNQQVSYLSAAGASGRVERRDRYKMMHRSDNFLQSFKDQLRKKCFNFYVIEIEFRPASMFNEIHRVVSNYTQFNTFLIECMQPEENMRKYQKQVRDFPEVSNYIEEMMNDRPSKNISLLDASEIYNRDFLSEKMSKIMINNIIKNDYSISAHNIVEPEVEKTENVFPDLKFLDNDGDHETQIEELLKDPNFIKLTQSSFTNLSIDPRTFQEKVKPDQDFLEAVIKTRAFRPKRKIEYNHKPLPDPYQHTLDFVPLKVFDYRHQTTEKLFELRDEIDIDEIVANKN